jgi:hypothetical protein
MTREEQLKILKIHLKRITKEFCEIWGTCHLELAEEIDQVMTEIREVEKSIQLEKEIIDDIKQINNNKKQGE